MLTSIFVKGLDGAPFMSDMSRLITFIILLCSMPVSVRRTPQFAHASISQISKVLMARMHGVMIKTMLHSSCLCIVASDIRICCHGHTSAASSKTSSPNATLLPVDNEWCKLSWLTDAGLFRYRPFLRSEAFPKLFLLKSFAMTAASHITCKSVSHSHTDGPTN